MKHWHALLLLAASLTGSGCALIEDASRNACVAVCTPFHVHKEKKRNRQWAEAAWLEVQAPYSGVCHSADYANGFKEGYCDHLFRGGDGEPPVVAPLHYRHVRYQTPQGYQAVQDWFEGYRHGAAEARNSGARSFITGPSALRNDFVPPAAPPQVVPYVPTRARPPEVQYETYPQPQRFTPPVPLQVPGNPDAPPKRMPSAQGRVEPVTESSPTPPRPLLSAEVRAEPVPESPPTPPRPLIAAEIRVEYVPESTLPPAWKMESFKVHAQFGAPQAGEEQEPSVEELPPNWTTSPLRLRLGIPSVEESPFTPGLVPTPPSEPVRRSIDNEPRLEPEPEPVRRPFENEPRLEPEPEPVRKIVPQEPLIFKTKPPLETMGVHKKTPHFEIIDVLTFPAPKKEPAPLPKADAKKVQEPLIIQSAPPPQEIKKVPTPPSVPAPSLLAPLPKANASESAAPAPVPVPPPFVPLPSAGKRVEPASITAPPPFAASPFTPPPFTPSPAAPPSFAPLPFTPPPPNPGKRMRPVLLPFSRLLKQETPRPTQPTEIPEPPLFAPLPSMPPAPEIPYMNGPPRIQLGSPQLKTHPNE